MFQTQTVNSRQVLSRLTTTVQNFLRAETSGAAVLTAGKRSVHPAVTPDVVAFLSHSMKTLHYKKSAGFTT